MIDIDIFAYMYDDDDCPLFIDDCHLLTLIKKKEKKHLYSRGLKWQKLIQHKYDPLSDDDYSPVTSQGKVTSNHKHHRI